MSCHHFQSKSGKISGMLCLANIYEYQGFVFEYHSYLGPCQLRKKDLEPAGRVSKDFWDMILDFEKLTQEQREEYRIYG